MGENNTVEKLKLENDTYNLKREYKYALERLEKVKAETLEIVDVKEKAFTEYELVQQKLTDVLNTISDEKLKWATDRNLEIFSIEKRKKEVDAVLDLKQSLDKKEEDLIKKEDKITLIRNEARAIELKNKQKETELIARENNIDEQLKQIENIKLSIQKEKEDFKTSVSKLLDKVKTL